MVNNLRVQQYKMSLIQSATQRMLMSAVNPSRLHSIVMRILTIILFVVAGLTIPNFLSSTNLSAIAYAAAPVGIAAVGLAAVTIGGNLFSLSLGSTAAFSSILFIGWLGLGQYTSLASALIVGLVVGFLQGVAVGVFRCNAIITTIASASIIVGIASLLSGGRTIMATIPLDVLGSGLVLPWLPLQAAIFLVIAIVVDQLVQRTRIGRELRLTGSNRQAAEMAGLRTNRAIIASYVLSSVCAALAGVLLAAQASSGNLLVAADLDFNAISAVLVGGIAIAGGRGRIIDAAVGAIFLSVLGNILLVNNFAYEIQLMVKGVAVLLSVALGALLLKIKW